MKFVFLFLLFIFTTTASATTTVGEILLVKGTVKVKTSNSIKKSNVKIGEEIHAGDLIVSSKNSSVQIKLKDGSSLVLDELSTIHFSSLYRAEQSGGKILYDITSRNAKNSLKIKTPFAVIGIKGTTFIINATKESSVSLKEGLIGVTSLNEDFALYRKKIEKEFNDYRAAQDAAMKAQMDGFEKYKNKQQEYAEVTYTKEFDLKAGNKISFDGLEAKESAFKSEEDDAFKHFKKLIDRMQ